MITFTVPGPPAPKGRPRVGKGRTYTPAKTKAAEQQVAWLCRAAMRGRKPIPGPVAVELTFTMPNRRRIDVDNLAKLVCDSINGIAYDDDSQIIDLRATKRFDGEPGTLVTITAAHE